MGSSLLTCCYIKGWSELVAEFLGEFHELVLLFFLDVAVGFEGDFFLVWLATGDHAVDDVRSTRWR